MLGAFAALALVLSAAGVYGVMSYGVAQRTREIGIRMALGARAGEVLGMVLASTVRTTMIGIAVGLVVSALATRGLGSILHGISALDPLRYALVPAVIGVVGLLAGTIPAIRAARVDPMESIRRE